MNAVCWILGTIFILVLLFFIFAKFLINFIISILGLQDTGQEDENGRPILRVADKEA